MIDDEPVTDSARRRPCAFRGTRGDATGMRKAMSALGGEYDCPPMVWNLGRGEQNRRRTPQPNSAADESPCVPGDDCWRDCPFHWTPTADQEMRHT